MGSLPGRVMNRTVVYSSFIDQETSRPMPLDRKFSSLLVDQGINRVVVGHKPQGDTPLLMQCPYGLKVIMSDSSYAKSSTRWPGESVFTKNYSGPTRGDTRGDVTSETVLTIDGEHGYNIDNNDRSAKKSKLFIHGTWSNGQHYAFDWNDDSEISSYLGLETKDQWWVKGVMNGVNKSTQEGFTFLLSKAKGFDVYNKCISHSDLVNKFVDFRT